jgi:hypothetical protein
MRLYTHMRHPLWRGLYEFIGMKTRRSEAALEIYLRITRQMGETLWCSKSQSVESTPALRRTVPSVWQLGAVLSV